MPVRLNKFFQPVRRRSAFLGAFLLIVFTPALMGKTLLFVDEHEILYRSGTKKVVHQLEKFEGNPVITPDNPERPWEKSIQWVSVYKDPVTGKFQMWYQAYSGKGAEDKRFKSVVAYAESEDGLTWTKPELDLFPYRTRGFDVAKTNIVLIGEKNGYGDRYANSVVVNPEETNPARRYKMVYTDWGGKPGEAGRAGIHVAFSPDGIHWTKSGEGVLQKIGFGAKTKQPPFEDESAYIHLKNKDGREWRKWLYTQTLSDAADALWDPLKKCYVIYGKMWFDGPDGGLSWKHGMGRSESKDFLNWTRPELLTYPNENDGALVEFHTSPVFIHAGMYLSLNQLFIRENLTIDVEFMSSRDGLRWDRTFAGQEVLVRGGRKYFDASFVLTNGNPIMVGDEMWFYYGANRGIPRFANEDEPDMPERARSYGSGVGLAKIKRDRFVGIIPDPKTSLRNWNPNDPNLKPEPPENEIGQITLKARSLEGVREIRVNGKTEEEGAIRIEILNADGYRLRGFTKDDAVPLVGDKLDFPVAWSSKSLADLEPGEYRIRIHLDRAEIFACELVEE